jgi:hypothetical protein
VDLISIDRIKEEWIKLGIYDETKFEAQFKHIENTVKEIASDIYVNLLHPEFGSFWTSEDCRNFERGIRADEANKYRIKKVVIDKRRIDESKLND